jgi:hypothetical protein
VLRRDFWEPKPLSWAVRRRGPSVHGWGSGEFVCEDAWLLHVDPAAHRTCGARDRRWYERWLSPQLIADDIARLAGDGLLGSLFRFAIRDGGER